MIAPPDIFLSFNREDQARAKGGKGPRGRRNTERGNPAESIHICHSPMMLRRGGSSPRKRHSRTDLAPADFVVHLPGWILLGNSCVLVGPPFAPWRYDGSSGQPIGAAKGTSP